MYLAVKPDVDVKQDFARLLLALIPQQSHSVMGSVPDWFSVRCGFVISAKHLNCLLHSARLR